LKRGKSTTNRNSREVHKRGEERQNREREHVLPVRNVETEGQKTCAIAGWKGNEVGNEMGGGGGCEAREQQDSE
jgi:hypothetical protein